MRTSKAAGRLSPESRCGGTLDRGVLLHCRHVKEFLAQTDDAFRGITLPWLRKAVKDGRQIDGAVREPVCRKTFAMAAL